MDPNAPHYDRPPGKKRRIPPAVAAALRAAAGKKPIRPPVATDGAAPGAAVPVSTPGSPKQVGAPKSTLPSKGSLGNISQFKQPANVKGPNGAKGGQIGFYNATHRHGEPIKALIAKLKARRGQGSKQRV